MSLTWLQLLLFVVFAITAASTSLATGEVDEASTSIMLDDKSLVMAHRLIQQIQDYSTSSMDNAAAESHATWKILSHVLKNSFLGIDVDNDLSNQRNYQSTPKEVDARIRALQWLTLDYDNFSSSSSSSNHRHHYHETGLLDRYALATIYFATDGDSWNKCPFSSMKDNDTNNNINCIPSSSEEQFLSSSSHLKWIGVNGNNRDGHVTMLDLSHRNIKSETFLPLEVVLLSPTLELLWLANNRGLSGSIPSYFGTNFASLSSLSLQKTSMSGTIPESLYNMTKLSSLRLYKSNFTGSISSNVGQLASLRWLWLHDNRFTGHLPQELGSLSKLEGMTLHGNEFKPVDAVANDAASDGTVVGAVDTTNDDGLKSNIIPPEVCSNLMTTMINEKNGDTVSGGGVLKHLWTDCEEDAVRQDRKESVLNSNVKACSCCTRCFPRSTKQNNN